jgi:uncharacterized membrane protein YgcG
MYTLVHVRCMLVCNHARIIPFMSTYAREDPYLPRVEALLSNIRNAAKPSSPLKAGSMMHLAVPGGVEWYFLVGCVAAQPCSMLILVEFSKLECGLLQMKISTESSKSPEALITTSAMAFKDILKSVDVSNPDAKHIRVSILNFTCGNDSVVDPVQFRISILGPSFAEDICFAKQVAAKAKSKPVIKLPFGLTKTKTKRVPKVKPTEAGVVDGHAGVDDHVPDLFGESSSSDSSSSDSSESSSSDSSRSGLSSSGTSSSGSEELDLGDLGTVDLEGLAELVEIEDAAAAEAALAVAPAPAPVIASADSLHHVAFGISGVGLAPTSRAGCHFCDHKILTGTARFKYIWHAKKPTRWMHRECVSHVPPAHRAQSIRSLISLQGTLGLHEAELREAVVFAIANLQ